MNAFMDVPCKIAGVFWGCQTWVYQLYKSEGRLILRTFLRSRFALQYTWVYSKSSTFVQICLICILNQVCTNLTNACALQYLGSVSSNANSPGKSLCRRVN